MWAIIPFFAIDSFSVDLNDTYDARRGKQFSVPCKTVKGSPPFQYRWTFNSSTILSTSKLLVIKTVTLQSAGDYSCQAIDSRNKEAQATFTLIVTCKFAVLIFKISNCSRSSLVFKDNILQHIINID